MQKPVGAVSGTPLEEKKPEYLIRKMDSARFDCLWLSAKISAETDLAGKTNSFSVTLRMKKDSLMWMSISSLGIEAARVCITRDSIRFIDRLNSKYKTADFNYLKSLLPFALDFEAMQSVLFGNYFSYLSRKELKSSYVDEKYYIVSTLRKRKLKRSLEEKEPNKRIIQDVWLEPNTFRVAKMSVDDNKLKRKLIVSYDNFTETDSLYFPHKEDIRMEGDKPAHISLEYSKVSVNKPQEFPFSIPEGYEQMR